MFGIAAIASSSREIMYRLSTFEELRFRAYTTFWVE